MNVATCEARKVQAMEAWRRGDLAEASAAWGELSAEYERHHFTDGLLALRFNHLLVALEAGDRPRIDALMASLGSQFLQIGDPSPLAADVARRICRLFAEPVAGVDHQATAALVALAADRIGGQIETPRLSGEGNALPTVAALEGLEAPDAALMILRQAARRPDADEPVWMDAVRRGFGPIQPLSPEASRVVEEAAQAIDADDLLHGYPLLVDAFEWALENDAALAAEWSLGLEGMEAEGLPERLAFVPSLPEDRRLRGTLALHHRLASALSGDAGAEGLALTQWAHAILVGRRWLELTRLRVGRGGGKADDVLREAEVGLLLADALIAVHDLAGAEDVLAASVARARRDAFDHRTVSSQVLRAQADLQERAGDDAEMTWLAAVEAALPGVDAASGIRRLARVVDVVLTEGVVDRARLGVEALAGLARTGAGELAPARLQRARALLAMLRPALTPDDAARTAMVVDLSAARLGDRAAAERALEAAHVVGDRAALALAALHRGWQAWQEADGAAERAAATELVGDAAAEAQRASAGAIRRGAEAAAAAVHQGSEADRGRAAVHLRRAVEATEGTSFEDGAGRWDHLLPADPSLRLDDVVERLVADGDAALARRLCAAGRRRALGLGARRPAPWAADIRDAHQVGFRAVWLGQGEPPEAEPTLEVGATEAAVWPRLRTGAADLQLEFRCFEDVTFLFATHGQGVRAHRIERGLGAWATDVDALRDASSSAGTRLEAVGTAIYNRLLGPVADLLALARRVIFVPDGPLFDLPFGLLRNDAGPLGEGMEMVVACPCAGPAFAGPPAPPAARIIGDDATARDLRISTLSGQGFFSAVEVRHGGDLTPAGLPGAVSEARVVHILGAIEADGGLGLIADGPSTPAADLGDALAEAGAVCATLMGPVEGDAGHAVVAELLPAVRGGVLVRRWETEEDGSFLLHFLAGAAHATDTWALAEALSAARRAAVRAQLPPSVWAAYALFVAET